MKRKVHSGKRIGLHQAATEPMHDSHLYLQLRVGSEHRRSAYSFDQVSLNALGFMLAIPCRHNPKACKHNRRAEGNTVGKHLISQCPGSGAPPEPMSSSVCFSAASSTQDAGIPLLARLYFRVQRAHEKCAKNASVQDPNSRGS